MHSVLGLKAEKVKFPLDEISLSVAFHLLQGYFYSVIFIDWINNLIYTV